MPKPPIKKHRPSRQNEFVRCCLMNLSDVTHGGGRICQVLPTHLPAAYPSWGASSSLPATYTHLPAIYMHLPATCLLVCLYCEL